MILQNGFLRRDTLYIITPIMSFKEIGKILSTNGITLNKQYGNHLVGICLKAWNYIMSGDTAYDGITYCAENNNELVQCPPIKRAGCKHFNKTLLGCVWHVSDKPYDYENSLEKLDKEYDQRRKQSMGLKLPTAHTVSVLENMTTFQANTLQSMS